jgi:hypothetical protein
MSVIAIQQPLLDGGIRSVNFFNGRVLSGEDLGTEQEGNRQAHARLGMSVGMGVVTGLNVTQSPPPLPGEPDLGSTVTVGQGMAINARGQTLQLYNDITVMLVNTPSAGSSPPGQGTFRASQTSSAGQYTLGAGLYLLTIAPAWGSDGFSPMGAFGNSGAGSSTAICNTRYSVDAIQFRLIPLTFSSGLLRDPYHLRNRIAYRCFGFTDESPDPPSDSFGPFALNARLLETLQQNTAQLAKVDLKIDVPLAILRWSSGGQPDFIDTWSVRRRLSHPSFTSPWQDAIGDQRLAEAEAMFLQFQSQIDDIQHTPLNAPVARNEQTTSNTLKALSAGQFFSYLPAAGYLPVGKGSFDWKTFLGSLAPPDITCVDRRFFRLILHNSFYESPIKVGPYTDLDSTPSGEPPLDVYQDPSQSDFVLFARSNTGRVLVTVNAQGYQPAHLFVSFTVGQQGQSTIPLTQGGPQEGQQLLSVDADNIGRPALHRVRFSIVQQPAKASRVLSKKIRVDPLPQNVQDWLSKWKTWLNYQYPNQGIDVSIPAIYINDYYSPPKPGDVPQEPSAYAVFGEFAVPLLVNLHYFTTPLPVPLSKAGITGLADDTVQALAGIGILSVDQVVGAWSQLIAHATGQSTEFGRYLIEDALKAVENLNSSHRYYEGYDAQVQGVLERLGIGDDVALANADQGVLGKRGNLNSAGLASRLIAQARQAVQLEHWSVQTLGLPSEQIPSLLQIGISSKGDFVRRAEVSQGHKQLESALQQDPHAIDQLYAKAIVQLTASSLALAHVKDLIMLANVNAEVATKLSESHINTVDEVVRAGKETLRQATGLSADAVENLKKDAEAAQKGALQVVKLASVSIDVANMLDWWLQVKTISQLLVQGEERVARALKASLGDRAGLFAKTLFDGFKQAGR